jgi:hypothetical protein
MKRTLLLLMLVFVLMACNKKSSKVEQSQIFQTLYISYNADENQTYFTAQFSKKKENGRLLELDENSSVTVNGQAMDFSGTVYNAKFDGVVDTGIFVYTDNDGNSYTNMVTSVGEISNGPIFNINKANAPIDWTFYGDPNVAGEEVLVEVVSQGSGRTYSRSNSTEIGATSITMTRSDLENLELGYATATTIRRRTIETGNFSSAGGLIISSRKSYSTTVNVQ